jgi:hypothetical protein
MTTATFQRGDRAESREFPEAAEGKDCRAVEARPLQGRLGDRAHVPEQDHIVDWIRPVFQLRPRFRDR